ncbi:hypothetical protein D3C87_2103290 [compost metagenome]
MTEPFIGPRIEGTHIELRFVRESDLDGEFHDLILMSMLEEEFRSLHGIGSTNRRQ